MTQQHSVPFRRKLTGVGEFEAKIIGPQVGLTSDGFKKHEQSNTEREAELFAEVLGGDDQTVPLAAQPAPGRVPKNAAVRFDFIG